MGSANQTEIDAILSNYSKGQIEQIPRLESPIDEELHRRFREAKLPFIATGRLKSWKATSWSFQYFREIAGASMVNPLVDLPASGNPYFWNDRNYYKKMTLAEFLDIIADRPDIKCYLGQKHIHRYPGAEHDFNFADLIGRADAREPFTSVWIGSKGTHSGLHFDRRDNVFVQILGRKFVMLAAPDQAKYLYSIKDMFEKSSINPAQPDFVSYPRLANAKFLTGVVGPGEFMFIPSLWWHYLRSLDPVISLNHWYGQEVSLIRLFKMISAGGIGHWYTTIVDGVIYGALRRPYKTRLLSDMPSGLLIYNAIASGLSRRLFRRSRSPERLEQY